jgi:Inositol monophosphatase family
MEIRRTYASRLTILAGCPDLQSKEYEFLAAPMNHLPPCRDRCGSCRRFPDSRKLHASAEVNLAKEHDLKLELDVRGQESISESLLRAYPNTRVLGEEGSAETTNADGDRIVDPIDGTVNFFYGVSHFSVSIAFRRAEQIEPTGSKLDLM